MFPLKKIEDICKVIAGQSPPSSTYNQNKEGLPFFQGKADFNEKYPTIRYWCTDPKRVSEIDDILMSVRAPVGSININNTQACIGRGLAAIRCGKKINRDFLYYYLSYKEREIADMGTGSTFKAITIKTLRGIKIPLPPLKTQEHIAGILDDAAALRDKTKQLLEEYDNLAQSIFLDMFGDPVINPKKWEEILLDDICGVRSSKRVFVKDLVEFGIPFYRGKEIGELSTGDFIEPSLFITQEHYDTLAKASGVPKIGDLLMPSICPDGRIFIVDTKEPFYFKDGRVLWIQVDQSKISSYYLIFFLKELFRTNYLNIASGTTFAELKIFALKKIKMLLPPINIQEDFAEKIALIEQQKDLARQELKESEDLFNCLLQKAFKGELVPMSQEA